MDKPVMHEVTYVGKHPFEYKSVERPWGFFDCFCENEKDITVKVIHIKRGENLSLQRHTERDQLYYVIDDMKIRYHDGLDLRTIDVHSGTTLFFPRGCLHQAFNVGPRETARFFEVCFGRNDENDIERVEDKYGRGNG